MAPYSLVLKNMTLNDLEQMSYRELQKKSKSLHLPANFKKVYLIKLIHAKINGKEEQVIRIINQAKYERLQAAYIRKKKSRQIPTALVIPTAQKSPPLTMTPKSRKETQVIRPVTLNMSERVLRYRETAKHIQNNESNEEYFASRDNPFENSKISFLTKGPRCAGILVPKKLRRTGIPEFKEQLKSLQPILITRKNELQMVCKDKCAEMEIVLRSVNSKSTLSNVENLNIAKSAYKVKNKMVTVVSSAAQKGPAGSVCVDNSGIISNQSLVNNTHCNIETVLNLSNKEISINENVDCCHNESDKMECNDMNNYPNLQANFEEPSAVPPRSSNSLTPIEVRTLNEHTPTCNYFINNNTDVVTPVSTRSFMADYFRNLNKELEIYFNPRNVKTLCANTTNLTVMNKNSIFYTGMISGLVTPTFALPCRPIASTDIAEKRTSYSWDLQILQPHDVLFYQPRDLHRESCGIIRNPLCILASQVTKIAEIEDDMDDVLEVISQDGDYVSRLGMNVKVKCVFCSWESTKMQFDNHLRKEHSDLIQVHNTIECVISFNLEQLINNEDWSSILIEAHSGFLYIVSGKLHKLDYLLVSIATVTKEQENKPVSVTAYNKQTSEPYMWYGEVQDLTTVDMNDANAHIKIELSRLDMIISGVHHQQLIIYSPSEPMDPNIVLYVKI